MNRKIRVAIIFGGRSAEHEVSLQSAINVIKSIDKTKYDPVLIGIDRDGKWYLNENSIHLLHENNPKLIQLNKSSPEVALTPTGINRQLINLSNHNVTYDIDVVFPVLHGPFGEDGSIQGLMKLANIPCVGADILGSAVAMDKDIMKRLLRDSDIPVARFICLDETTKNSISFDSIKSELGLPLFIKPANLGSSVGISKTGDVREYREAVNKAFQFDTKVIVEEYIPGREIECAVLGNSAPKASVPGEIIPSHDFYSYDAKYVDENGALLAIPAKLTGEQVRMIQAVSIKVYRVLACKGMARVDMFLQKNDKIIINEINTLPGFTHISMYPKLWEYSGISQEVLIDKLITLAIEDFEKRNNLKITVT